MKLALVFNGLPRQLERSSNRFHECLLSRYDVDVYSYCWSTGTETNLLYNLYDHRVICLMREKDFSHLGKQNFNLFANFYGIQNACRMFNQYCIENQLTYDAVIRTRHDIYFHDVLKLETLEFNKYNVSDCHWKGVSDTLFDDNLTITSQKNYINFYHDIYNWYRFKEDRLETDFAEIALYQYFESKSLLNEVKRNQNLDFTLTRGVL